MIACIGKNNRCRPLFEALSQADPNYRFIGTATASRNAKILGAVRSFSTDKRRVRQLLEFSPSVAKSLEASCVELVTQLPDKPSHILYWGATNLPVDLSGSHPPYSIITDGPYDPSDPIYPDIWQPGRWSTHYLALQHQVFSEAQHVFTLSEWARQKLIKVHSMDPDRVTRIGWGPLYSLGASPRLENGKGKKIILSVGNHWYLKGMDTVAQAGELLAKQSDDFETIIVGEPHGLDIKPAKGVTLVPHGLPIAAVHALLRQAAVLVVASRFDASPHVIPEALQYGVPVVGSNVCGIPEVTPEGCLFDASNRSAESLAHVIRKAVTDTTIHLPEVNGWVDPASIIVKTLRD